MHEAKEAFMVTFLKAWSVHSLLALARHVVKHTITQSTSRIDMMACMRLRYT